MGSTPKAPSLQPIQAQPELPPPPMQESPYAKGSAARKSAATMAAGLAMGGTLISKRVTASDEEAGATGKTLLGV